MDKLDLILQQMEGINVRFDKLEAELKGTKEFLNERIDRLHGEIVSVEGRLRGEIVSVEERLRGEITASEERLRAEIKAVDEKVHEITLRIDNEMIPAIHIVAEGHLDLNRKLDRALEDRKEREILSLRILHLESRVDRMERDREAQRKKTA